MSEYMQSAEEKLNLIGADLFDAESLLYKWMELAERLQRENPLALDANMYMDFHQGISSTKTFLERG